MSFFFPRLKREKNSLIVNIGSGEVSMAVAKFTERAGVSVSFYTHEKIPLQKNVTPSKHLDLLQKTVTNLGLRLQKRGVPAIQNVFYIFSSPWSISETRIIRIKETKSINLNENYLKRLLADKKRNVTTDFATHGRIIEQKVIQVKINGYPVDVLSEHQTKEAEIAVFMTAVPDKVITIVEDALAKTLVRADSHFHSSTLALFSTIRDLFPNEENFVSVSYSGEMTEVSVIKNGVIFSEATFPFGRNTFVRRLAELENVSEEIADSSIKISLNKGHNELAGLRTLTNIKIIADAWYAEFDRLLKHFMEKLYVPHTIFFISSQDLTSLLVERLKETGFEITPILTKKVSSPVRIDDIMFKTCLMFLDKMYKI